MNDATLADSATGQPDPARLPHKPPAPPGMALPQSRTALIGRKHEVESIGELLRRADVPLVVLTGTGGAGKTRLALQVAAEFGTAFADGVCFVELAPIRDPALVLPAIAQALSLTDQGVQPTAETLVAHLQPRDLLLVLDNFEQVVAAAPRIADLLIACPQLTVLVTSRVVLHLSGEHVVPVNPLPTPDAVQLFVTRAKASSPDFSLTTANQQTVAALCARLDGLPLAIELAAARIRTLSPSALLARLAPQLQLLTGGARDAPARLQTMHDAIAWSYDLLDPIEQIHFGRLAIFVGSFDLGAAESVCKVLASREAPRPGHSLSPGLPADPTMLDMIQSLVEKSLLQLVSNVKDEHPRYRMLETVREFGLERLAASDEESAVRAAHAAHFLMLAEAAEPELEGPQQAHWQTRLEADVPNLDSAVEWSTSHDMETALRLAGALGQFWLVRGALHGARDVLERMLASGQGTPAARAKGMVARAWILFAQGDFAGSASQADEAIALSRVLDDDAGRMRALLARGFALTKVGGEATLPEEGQALAEAALEDHLALAHMLGDRRAMAMARYGLGTLALQQGDPVAATGCYAEALSLFTVHGDRRSTGWTLANMGHAAVQQGDDTEASRLFRSSLAAFHDLRDRWSVAHILREVALLLMRGGRAEDAIRLNAAAASLLAATGVPAEDDSHISEQLTAVAKRSSLTDEACALAWASGRLLTEEEAVEHALALLGSVAAQPAGNAFPDLAGTIRLTRREHEILRLLADGLSDRDIAQVLSISPRTVSGHVTNLMTKLDVDSRTAAAAHAIRHGLA